MKVTNEYKPFKVALVALDLTELDDRLIQYASLMAKVLPLEQIYFVHVAKDLALPADLLEEYPNLLGPQDESIEADIQQKIDKYFSAPNVAVKCIIKEGNPIDKILKLCKIKDVDLIFMGRKRSLHGSGIASSGIARKCPCSLLLVTEDSKLQLNKVLVPVDFSNHSSLAMRQAIEARSNNGFELSAIHIYSVPSGYHKTGKSFEEFSDVMKTHAQKNFRQFLESNDFPSDIPCEYELTKDAKYAPLAYEYAEKHNIDLIIIGSKGRTAVSSILMGSVAEKLVYIDSHIPVLIVKSKGENMSFLDALMKI
ncbi:MAG: universal stress protein [Fulvivirga sp.]|uniref:universal stress protein n=1 Tax=Fulvivirga sp. TaxID=1931237 RepID=UPI0032EC7678